MRIEDDLTLWLPLRIDLDYHVIGEKLPSMTEIITPSIVDIDLESMRIVDAEGHSYRLLGEPGATESMILGVLREFLVSKGLTTADVEELEIEDVAVGLASKTGRAL